MSARHAGWPDLLPKCDFCDMTQEYVAASDTSSKRVAILANRRHDDGYRQEKGKNGAWHRISFKRRDSAGAAQFTEPAWLPGVSRST
jgi:hypothetical protein